MMSAAKKTNSIYLFETQPSYHARAGHVESDYVLNTGMNQHEIENEHRRAAAEKVPSEYMEEALRNMDATEKAKAGIAMGLPMSGTALRRRLTSIDNQVYVPLIIAGQLYFVAPEANVRTGRDSSAIDLPTSNVETAHEISSGMMGPESGVDTARTIDSSIAVADMSSSVVNIPMGILERNLPNDAFRKVLHAVMKSVSSGEMKISAGEAVALTRAWAGACPSESTETAAGFGFYSLSNDGSYIQTGAQKSTSALTARSHGSVTARAPSERTERTTRSTASARTARSHSADTATAHTFTDFEPSFYTGAEKSASARTAFSNTSLRTGARRSASARTAFSNASLQTGAQRSASARTAFSNNSLRTGAQRSDSAHTAFSNASLRTGAQRSDSAHTAFSNASLRTGAQRSDSAQTAFSRESVRTGAQKSTSACTAYSRDSLRTGAQKSDSALTARSDFSLMTGAQASDPAYTARSDISLYTGAQRSASTRTGISPSIDSYKDVTAHRLTHTPSDFDNRAASALASVTDAQ